MSFLNSIRLFSFHDKKQHTLIAPQLVRGENMVMPAQNTGPALSRGKPSGILMMNLTIIMIMTMIMAMLMKMIMTVIMTVIKTVIMTMIIK